MIFNCIKQTTDSMKTRIFWIIGYHILNKASIFQTGDYEHWLCADEDFDRWSDGFGKENFNLIIAADKTSNKTVGSIATLYFPSIEGSEPLAIIGMFFVVPELRGAGLGAELWTQAFKDPKFDGVNFGLLGVDSMHKKYANRYGFDKYMSSRFKEFMAEAKDVDPGRLEADPKIRIIDPKTVDPQKFIEFDTELIGGIRRDNFILKFFASESTFSKVALGPGGEIVGVGGARIVYQNQLAIGPLYADSKSVAEALLKAVLESIPNLNEYSNIFMFPTAINEDARKLFDKLADGKVKVNEDFHGQFTKRVIQVSAILGRVGSQRSHCHGHLPGATNFAIYREINHSQA